MPNKYSKLLEIFGSPLFLYDIDAIKQQFQLVKNSFNYSKLSILYSVKANSNIHIIKEFKKMGSKIDASSPGDIFLAKKSGFSSNDIFITAPNLNKEDIKYCVKQQVHIDVDSIEQIKEYGQINPNSTIGIRINPRIGTGFHKSLNSGDENSKLGIDLKDLKKAIQISKNYNLKINGIHYHIGSSSYNLKPFIDTFKIALKLKEILKIPTPRVKTTRILRNFN